MQMQNSLLKQATTTAQYLWAEYPLWSGNIICERKDLLHTEWFQELGLPSWGNAFDRIACGIIKVNKANKTAVIQTYHPDFAPREVWQYFRKKLPAEFSLDEEKYNPDQDKQFEKKYSPADARVTVQTASGLKVVPLVREIIKPNRFTNGIER